MLTVAIACVLEGAAILALAWHRDRLGARSNAEWDARRSS
jgi:hypothetical protein